jgi:hypothetical protein
MPQMVVGPFMAGTMIEDRFCVKAPPAGARARAVNAGLTPPSHCSAAKGPEFAGVLTPFWGNFMRFVIAAAALATVLFGAASAQAEKRIFIIANNADGYGVDRCLASGAECGATVANSYCKSRDYAQALSFSKVDRDDITGAIPTSGPGSCSGGTCDNFVAIVCSR